VVVLKLRVYLGEVGFDEARERLHHEHAVRPHHRTRELCARNGLENVTFTGRQL